jgi:hypothetical protein
MKNTDGHKQGARAFLKYRIHLEITEAKKGDMGEVPD